MTGAALDPWDAAGADWQPWCRMRVYYAIYGPDLDPDAVTAATGLEPDTLYRAGELKPNRRIRKDGFWKLHSGLPQGAAFEAHVDALLTRLRPAWSTLVELGRRHHAYVEAAIDLNHSPGLGIGPAAMAALVELNAELGFDLYLWAPQDPPTGPADAPAMTQPRRRR